MPRVTLGFGPYSGYKLTELPPAPLDELRTRFPLTLKEHDLPDHEDVLITLAVHAELQRRAGGGLQDTRRQKLRELAADLIERGYEQAKLADPDPDRLKRLDEARRALLKAARNLTGETNPPDTIVILAPGKMRPRPVQPHYDSNVTDEDVPF